MTDVTMLTAEIVASAAANDASRMRPDELVSLIKSVRAALSEADGDNASGAKPTTKDQVAPLPKAQWSKLLHDGKIKSLIDGKSYSTLKRHLGRHGHDPKSYREAFGLPVDFPMVSADYSARRSKAAKDRGFGRAKSASSPPTPSPSASKSAPKPRAKKG